MDPEGQNKYKVVNIQELPRKEQPKGYSLSKKSIIAFLDSDDKNKSEPR